VALLFLNHHGDTFIVNCNESVQLGNEQPQL
jgi:hypothetical protein